jgi:hypothetical protein
MSTNPPVRKPMMNLPMKTPSLPLTPSRLAI